MAQQRLPEQRIKSQSFSFQNLEPINYLKNFNKMLDYMSKPISAQLTDPGQQLKVVKLSKFPLHPYYEQMQGIIQGHHKKHNEGQKQSMRNIAQQQLEQKFLNKHYTIVKHALNKIIQDNETQQNILVKSKNFYQLNQLKRNQPEYEAQIVKMVKMRSEPKLRSIRSTIDSARKTVLQSTHQQSIHHQASMTQRSHVQTSRKSISLHRKQNSKLAQCPTKTMKTEHSSVHKQESRVDKKLQLPNEQRANQQRHNPIFRKLNGPHVLEKFTKRNFQEVDLLLTARKTMKQTQNNQQAYPLTERTHHSMNETKKVLVHQKKTQPHLMKNDQTFIKQFQLKSKKSMVQSQEKYQDQDKSIGLEGLIQFRKQISLQPQRKKSIISSGGNEKIEIGNADQQFIRDVQQLQKQQSRSQSLFAATIEDKIKTINQKLNQRIQQVKKFDYSIVQQKQAKAKEKS